MSTLLSFGSGILTLILMDAVWLGWIMSKTYKSEVGTLMKATPNWAAALMVYLAIASAIYFFVLPKANSLQSALLWGALFGFLSYALYDFTNLAVIKDWTLKITMLDITWGAILCGTASVVMLWVLKHV